ncbi:hypothetical protein ACFS07_34210 [Undibacterium arcticum]
MDGEFVQVLREFFRRAFQHPVDDLDEFLMRVVHRCMTELEIVGPFKGGVREVLVHHLPAKVSFLDSTMCPSSRARGDAGAVGDLIISSPACRARSAILRLGEKKKRSILRLLNFLF